MDTLSGKVAVVTGAAKGIGFALASCAIEEGMSVAIADVDSDALKEAARRLRANGANVLSVVTDVADLDAVTTFADACYQAYGRVDLLCNNAGIVTAEDFTEYAWHVPPEAWRRTVAVNLWGVINGCLAFIPRMLKQSESCYILNTASTAGLTAGSSAYAVYRMTKYAIVALSESLSMQLQDAGARIQVSVLCPFFVSTSIADSALKGWTPRDSKRAQKANRLREVISAGVDAAGIARTAFRGLRQNWFYIVPDERSQDGVRTRFDAILAAYKQQHA